MRSASQILPTHVHYMMNDIYRQLLHKNKVYGLRRQLHVKLDHAFTLFLENAVRITLNRDIIPFKHRLKLSRCCC